MSSRIVLVPGKQFALPRKSFHFTVEAHEWTKVKDWAMHGHDLIYGIESSPTTRIGKGDAFTILCRPQETFEIVLLQELQTDVVVRWKSSGSSIFDCVLSKDVFLSLITSDP